MNEYPKINKYIYIYIFIYLFTHLIKTIYGTVQYHLIPYIHTYTYGAKPNRGCPLFPKKTVAQVLQMPAEGYIIENYP